MRNSTSHTPRLETQILYTISGSERLPLKGAQTMPAGSIKILKPDG